MKNKTVVFFVIIVLGYLLTLVGPWYLIVLAGFSGGMLLKSQWSALYIGFLAGIVLWAVHIWLVTNASESDLPARMAQIFTLPNETILVVVSALVGGLVTGFASAAGGSLRKIITNSDSI